MKTVLVWLLLGALPVLAQSDRLSFEVASIKPNTSIDGIVRVSLSPSGLVRFTRFSLRDLIWTTYGTAGIQGPDQIEGGPGWLATDHFDIEARAAADIGPVDGRRSERLMAMVKSLIEDRFRVRVHVETRPAQTYVLVLADKAGRLGPRIHPTTHDCPKEARCGVRLAGAGLWAGQGVTLDDIARSFANQSIVNRPVRNGTGLTGRFDFEVEFTPPPSPESASPGNAEFNGSILRAAEDQLGLKLRSEKGTADFLVIDHAERPTED